MKRWIYSYVISLPMGLLLVYLANIAKMKQTILLDIIQFMVGGCLFCWGWYISGKILNEATCNEVKICDRGFTADNHKFCSVSPDCKICSHFGKQINEVL